MFLGKYMSAVYLQSKKAVPDLCWICGDISSDIILIILAIISDSCIQLVVLNKSLNPCYKFILLVENNARII